jgi:hypothetical protein
MAALVTAIAERRQATRVVADAAGWKVDAVLRPGVLVRILNISPHGVLLESTARLRPGRRAEMQLTAAEGEQRPHCIGRITRCLVVGVSPLVFQCAIAFDGPLPVGPIDE